MMKRHLVWFRRDLRDYDHAALYHALKTADEVVCAFVFDTDILNRLTDKTDRRVEFIWESVKELKEALQRRGGDLIVLHGRAEEEIVQLAQRLDIAAVFSNRDYEPAAIGRDQSVSDKLRDYGIAFLQYKDQVIFEKQEVLTQSGQPYGVFTPYKRSWLAKLSPFYLKAYPVQDYMHRLAPITKQPMPSLEEMGFKRTNLKSLPVPTGMTGAGLLFKDFCQRLDHYHEARNYPAVKGVSYLSVHLRFGTISIRELAAFAHGQASEGAQGWLNELIWRDFYFQVLFHRPDLADGQAFKAEYHAILFTNNSLLFKAWCEGMTGYPIVDAAMRQLNQTGYMHNRLRMVAASFLVKDLLVDWRWGEAYFARKLIDFDLAANNGGWQWAASTGCDAQPYFRIFNPVTQSEKFDPKGQFIRRYVPEIAHLNDKDIHQPWQNLAFKQQSSISGPLEKYPFPIVNHAEQRTKAIDLYKKAAESYRQLHS